MTAKPKRRAFTHAEPKRKAPVQTPEEREAIAAHLARHGAVVLPIGHALGHDDLTRPRDRALRGYPKSLKELP